MNFFDDIDCYGDRAAIITEQGERLSYRQFLQEADAFLGCLKERETMFLVCNNCLESVCAYIGALRKKVVLIMIHSAIDRELYQQLYDTYCPDYICAPDGWCADRGGKLEEIADCRSYRIYQTGWDLKYEVYPELAMLLSTSGSTGSPKMVRQSYGNIIANAESIAQYLDIQGTDRAITTMPMSYTYGLSIINSHLLRGACLILNGHSIVEREFWSFFHEVQPTTFGGVPFIYEQLKALRFGRMRLEGLRYITQAGGKLSKELTEEFNACCKEKGIRFIVMYGQTEATARMSYLPWEYALEKAGSIGKAIPGGSFSLLDMDGREIEQANMSGELVYRGENVTLGYAEGYGDLGQGDENHGILHTGDMAVRDEDGFYYIVGRKKRFLKLYGNRVNLDEVEGILRKQGYSCVCSGEDDCLKIYTTVEDEKEQRKIKEFISHALGFTSRSFQVIYLDEIPRNEAGKVLYSALK